MYAWNVDGIKIPEVCTFDAHQQAIVGIAIHEKPSLDRGFPKGFSTRTYKWWATVGAHGFTVVLEDERRLKQTYVGSTFNVFCEVAGAIRRLG